MNADNHDDNLLPSIIGMLTEGSAVEPLAPARKAAVWSRILQHLPAPEPTGTLTRRADEGPWIRCLPGVDIRILYVDETHHTQTALWRMQPGAVLPAHLHSIDEECLVLDGEIRAGEFVVRKGDFHVGFAGQAHSDIHSDSGALLLIRSERKHLPELPR